MKFKFSNRYLKNKILILFNFRLKKKKLLNYFINQKLKLIYYKYINIINWFL